MVGKESAVTVEVVGGVIVARVRGEPTAAVVAQLQHRVLALATSSGVNDVLYDAREMTAPPVDVPLAQRALDATLHVGLRRAVVVPDTRLAYLARLAFGDGDYRVFYDDIEAARRWLAQRR